MFGLTHNYTGYPMVRQAREMVAAGELGAIRVVQVEYPQDWLTDAAGGDRPEAGGVAHRPGAQRRRPAASATSARMPSISPSSSPACRCEQVAADLTTFVAGRALDDNARMLLRFAGGARGMLWASQVAAGNENALRLRVYGEKASLDWAQEQPNALLFAQFGEPPRLIRRNGAGATPVAGHACRIPAGHPEGYLEAFAQLYRDLADQISAHRAGRKPDPASLLVPGIAEGVRGMRFITASVASSRDGAGWTKI